MSTPIDIKGIDKAQLLAGLYNRSKPLGLGYLQATPNDMTLDQARAIIAGGELDFDYLQGRVMKVNLKGDTLNPGGYDRDIGQGAAQSVVEAIRSGQPAPKNTVNLTGDLEATIARAKPSSYSSGSIPVFNLGIDEELVAALEGRRTLFRPTNSSSRASNTTRTSRYSDGFSSTNQQKTRLTADMSISQSLIALTEGNPGSFVVFTQLMKTVPLIDPHSMAIDGNDFMILFNADSLGLYGPKAHILHKYICDENIEKTATVIRGWQLGFVSKETIQENISAFEQHRQPTLDVDNIIRKVQQRLPGYKLIVKDDPEAGLTASRAATDEVFTPKSVATPTVTTDAAAERTTSIAKTSKNGAVRFVAAGSLALLTAFGVYSAIVKDKENVSNKPAALITAVHNKAKPLDKPKVPEVVHSDSSILKIRALIEDGFDTTPVVAGHHIKTELAEALDANDWRHVVARLADAGYANFNGSGHTTETRMLGAEMYGLANQIAIEEGLSNPNAQSVERSVQWLQTTRYAAALDKH